ncbi:MAG: TRAP transporter small permease subunit [Pseudomonadota bacterium]
MGLTLRKTLDRTYLFAGYLAALFLVLILCLVAFQMVARWIGISAAGAPDITGYSMAASSFLAFSYALNNGSHIRVSLLLNAAGRFKWHVAAWCWIVASICTVLFAWFAVKLTIESYTWNDISGGQDAWPLWIPQVAMSVGTVLFAVCTLDNLVTHLMTGKDNVHAAALDMNAE